jgi:hypothetical protein
MIKTTLVSSFRSTRLILWCLIVLCHCLIIVFLSRSNLGMNTRFLNSVMTIVPINRLPPSDSVPLTKLATSNKKERKPPELQTALNKSTKTVDANVSEQVSVEKGSKNELASASLTGSDSGKDLTTLASIANRYQLQVPKSVVEETLTPAQQAAQDVRSNSAKLTKSEKFSVAMGTLDCVFQARLADGKVVREPGKWVEVPARSNVTKLVLAKSRFCVRLHQAEDANGNDLTAISSGIKGKL